MAKSIIFVKNAQNLPNAAGASPPDPHTSDGWGRSSRRPSSTFDSQKKCKVKLL